MSLPVIPFVVAIDSEAGVHVARLRARELASTLGWQPTRVAELETAVSEIATNTWVHAHGGELEFTVEDRAGDPVIVVVARDEGPGIVDLDRAMRDGTSTAGTLGLGLSALTRLMDDVSIETAPGVGTAITISKSERRPTRTVDGLGGLSMVEVSDDPGSAFGSLSWVRASRPKGTGSICGDGAVVRPTRNGELIAVVDGAGHGPPAAEATAVALSVIARFAEKSPSEILERCHASLTRSVGAAASIIKLDGRSSTITWAGIGNVEAAIFTPGDPRPHHSLVPRAGTLGYQVPEAREVTVEILPDDLVVVWTDGIRAGAVAELDASRSPRELATSVLAVGARSTDDALVLAAHYLGGVLL